MTPRKRARTCYLQAKACLRCRSNVQAGSATKLFTFPCGHIMCQSCFYSLPPFKSYYCSRCGSCVWRAGLGPEYACPHPVPFHTSKADEQKPEVPDAFFRADDQTIEKSCAECVARALLQSFSTEAHALGVSPDVYACLRPGSAEVGEKGHEDLIQGAEAVEDRKMVLTELEQRMTEQIRERMSPLYPEQGWRTNHLESRINFQRWHRNPYYEAETEFLEVDDGEDEGQSKSALTLTEFPGNDIYADMIKEQTDGGYFEEAMYFHGYEGNSYA